MIRDGAAVLGFLLVGTGCWLVSPALACVVAGGILLGFSLWGHLNEPAR